MFFQGWTEIGRVILVGALAYIALVAILRISGNRTLSKMNAFDLVVTVALGSTLATILLSKDVALAEGVVALALLVALQYLVTTLTVKSDTMSQLIKSEPRLLLYQGTMLNEQLHQARVVKDEVLSAIRQQGIGSIDDVEAVVLETDGSFSVVSRSSSSASAVAPVRNRVSDEAIAAATGSKEFGVGR